MRVNAVPSHWEEGEPLQPRPKEERRKEVTGAQGGFFNGGSCRLEL